MGKCKGRLTVDLRNPGYSSSIGGTAINYDLIVYVGNILSILDRNLQRILDLFWFLRFVLIVYCKLTDGSRDEKYCFLYFTYFNINLGPYEQAIVLDAIGVRLLGRDGLCSAR